MSGRRLTDVRRDDAYTRDRQVREVKTCQACGWQAPAEDRCGACATPFAHHTDAAKHGRN